MKKCLNILTVLLAVLLILPVGAQAAQLIPGGQLVGLEICDNTLTVAAFDEADSPGKQAGLQIGDRLTHINGEAVCTVQQVREILKNSTQPIQLQILRKGQTQTLFFESKTHLGVYLKQGITGVGTVTYYNPENQSFGALGHCVTNAKGDTVQMDHGNAFDAHVVTIKKGKSGEPGQIVGAMEEGFFGVLTKNTLQGVFGKTENTPQANALETASSKQVRTGNATIRCTVADNGVQDYSVKIIKIYPASRSGGRNMLIKITDERLLETTGGIVQGMSGSPIIQDGKLIGAVTHVLVNDPTTGYGIFIENMLDAAA